MKTLKWITAIAFLVGINTINASALSITPATLAAATGMEDSNLSADQLSAKLGLPAGALTEVYKRDVGASDVGTFASSYKTTFSNTANDPSDALIEYVSGSSIAGDSIYLYVKGGAPPFVSPHWYLFDISSWNGLDDIVLTGFWPSQGAISHVTILTGPDRPPSVPDVGVTLPMLGAAFACLGLYRRYRK